MPQLKILITAGPTREMLDPVRFLSNLSTGTMGYELARAARHRGFRVTLISGPTVLKPPKGVRFVPVITVRDMKQAILRHWAQTDILVMTAAVCDYTPVHLSPHKIKRIKQKSVRFKRTEDLLRTFGRRKGKRVLVGFALETENFLRNARRKLNAKNLDLLVLNYYTKRSKPFGASRASMVVMDRLGRQRLLRRMPKARAAREILKEAARFI